jgi:uncharacterized damage-inducible protein DinB
MNAAQFFDHWNIIHRDLLRAVAVLDDVDLDFQPAEHYSRTVEGIIRHVINLEKGWIHFVINRSLDGWPEDDSVGFDTVVDMREELDEVFNDTMDILATIPVEDFNRVVQVPDDGVPKLSWILWHVFEQHIHHRGELFLCLSLLGKERPKIDRPG